MDSNWVIEIITRDNDLGLWKVKMQVILIQQKCVQALKEKAVFFVTMSQAKKTEIVDKVMSVIVLCLRDKGLRDVAKQATTTSMWVKLESLYMIMSFGDRKFLKQQLYSFRIVESKTIMDQLTKFNKILDDLENIECES